MIVKSCDKLEKSQVELTIEVNAEEFEKAREQAYRKNRNKIRIPGFRPGKAPRKVIERMYGSDIFDDDAVNFAFPKAYESAVEEQNLRVVGVASVEIETGPSGDGFVFRATVPVYPEVTLGAYKGLSAVKPAFAVTDGDIDAELKALTDRNTRLVSVEREAREGDTVTIDFDGYLNGKPFDGGKADHHNLELGSHSFVPGFEEQLVGMKAGDQGEINITFPEDYTDELAGKDVVFKILVHEVKEKDVPALDDEFAKDVSEFDTLDELKADLRQKLEKEKQDEADRAFEDALMDQVAEAITADIPDVMIENQKKSYLENFKMRLAQQGIPYEQYIQIPGVSEEQILQDTEEPATHHVRLSLAIAAIVEAENLEVSDEDVNEEYRNLANEYRMEMDSVRKFVPEAQVRDQLLTRKAIKIVTDNAVALEQPEEPENKEPENQKPEGTEQN